MAIFISYSHHDTEFVDKLAAQLVMQKARVWIDRWELNVGDSLLDRIQEALQTAAALIVVLSKASVESEWCKKELSAGLLRELEEKRVVVLPVLLDDCEIPIFLRGKKYADFRGNFDAGLRMILEAGARVTSEGQGRLESPEWHTDWSQDWGIYDGRILMRVTSIEQAVDKPYTVLTEVAILGNDAATKRYVAFQAEGLDWIERQAILQSIANAFEKEPKKHQLVIEDQFLKERRIEIGDRNSGAIFSVHIGIRRLGEDNGKDVFLDYGEQFRQICAGLHRTLRRPTAEENTRLRKILETLD